MYIDIYGGLCMTEWYIGNFVWLLKICCTAVPCTVNAIHTVPLKENNLAKMSIISRKRINAFTICLLNNKNKDLQNL